MFPSGHSQYSFHEKPWQTWPWMITRWASDDVKGLSAISTSQVLPSITFRSLSSLWTEILDNNIHNVARKKLRKLIFINYRDVDFSRPGRSFIHCYFTHFETLAYRLVFSLKTKRVGNNVLSTRPTMLTNLNFDSSICV